MTPKIKYTKLFINNEWCDAESGRTFETINPSNGKVICSVAEGDKGDVDKAVKAAREAFKQGSAWRRLDMGSRGALIYKLAQLMERDLDELVSIEILDNGKPEQLARDLTIHTINAFKYYAGWCDKLCGQTIPVSENMVSYTRHEPIGVVGQIIPSNFPTVIIGWKLGAALACGCTIVMKPSEETPLNALYIAALIKEAGFPPGVVNVVTGFGKTAGVAISSHMDINKISFTGSIGTGKTVMELAAKSNLKHVTLELGGKGAMIVLPDVDVPWAVQQAHHAVMTNQGQVCTSASRTFVHEDIYEEFVQKSVQVAASRKIGDPMKPGNDFGPLISIDHLESVLSYIAKGKAEGAKLMFGGEKQGDEGYFIQPTVFCDVTDDMTIAKEEIFGPVQTILKFKTVDEVIERANKTHFGLTAGVLTKNMNNAMKISNRLQSGTVWLNCYNIVLPQCPFGGYKLSGIGRELGEYALKEYCEVKTVMMMLEEEESS